MKLYATYLSSAEKTAEHAAAHALAEQRPSPRGQPCVRMLGNGRPLLAVRLDNSQHAGGLPICHYPGVNNLLAQNS